MVMSETFMYLLDERRSRKYHLENPNNKGTALCNRNYLIFERTKSNLLNTPYYMRCKKCIKMESKNNE